MATSKSPVHTRIRLDPSASPSPPPPQLQPADGAGAGAGAFHRVRARMNMQREAVGGDSVLEADRGATPSWRDHLRLRRGSDVAGAASEPGTEGLAKAGVDGAEDEDEVMGDGGVVMHSRNDSDTVEHGDANAGVSGFSVEDTADEEHCVICLHTIRDRTVLPCAHDRLCFECISVWCQQSRKCPLCNAPIGPFLIHHLRSKYDYSKYYLPPMRAAGDGPSGAETLPPLTPLDLESLPGPVQSRGRARGQQVRWGPRRRTGSMSQEQRETADELEIAIERRRWVYRHGLYAKHVASNPFTRYRPAPTPAQISASPDLISRATIFVRRELRVWVNMDVEFLTTFILSLMKSLDLRSESAVKLLAEFLDMDTRYYVGDPEQQSSAGRFTNAEHFTHELYSYLRSPFRDLAAYDASVQYDTPSHVCPAPAERFSEENHWNLPAPNNVAHGNTQPRPASPPPLRSPKYQHSRSLSSAHSSSHDGENWRHWSPPPAASRRTANGTKRLSRANYIRDPAPKKAAVVGKDTKGKGKAPARPQPETRKRHREDDHDEEGEKQPDDKTHAATTTTATRDRDHVRRRSRSLDQSGAAPHHSSSETSDSDRRARQRDLGNGRSFRSDSPPPPHATTDVPVLGAVTAQATPTGQEAVRLHEEDLKTVDHRPETGDSSWGISIKGQAKLIDLATREQAQQLLLPESSRDPCGVVDGDSAASPPRKRPRNSSSLGVLHAHLGHALTARRRDIATANEPPVIISTEKEPQKPMTAHGTPSECCAITVTAEEMDSPLEERKHEQREPTSRISAREIMARTRAKLKTQSPQNRQLSTLHPIASSSTTTSTSGTPPASASGLAAAMMIGEKTAAPAPAPAPAPAQPVPATPPANLDLRARLMRRLEEAKRQATTPQTSVPFFHAGRQASPSDSNGDRGQLAGGQDGSDACDASRGGGSAVDGGLPSSSSSRQAEAKLRAQALLRVRLAAERRQADVPVARVNRGSAQSREEALRERLLSRRT